MSDSKNEAVRLLEDISSKLTKLIFLSDAQGSRTASTLQAPTLETVLKFARAIFCEQEIAEIWFYANDAVGWMHNGQPIIRWQSMLMSYAKTCARNDRQQRPDEPEKFQSKMDDTIISEAQRAGWIKKNRQVWIDAGCPHDISELVAS